MSCDAGCGRRGEFFCRQCGQLTCVECDCACWGICQACGKACGHDRNGDPVDGG